MRGEGGGLIVLGGNCLGGAIFLGGNCPWGSCPGEELSCSRTTNALENMLSRRLLKMLWY